MKTKNIFLDFMSPDNWKTYATIPKTVDKLFEYRSLLVSQIKQSINVSILLTLEYCLLPPAFIIQSDIVFEAISESSIFLDEGLVYFPLRETDINSYINKKITEYSHVKDTHKGFYNKQHWDFLYKYRQLLIPRNSPMGLTIAKQWISISDNSLIWKPINELIPSKSDELRCIPQILKTRGESVTLEAVQKELSSNVPSLDKYINQAIQHEYLKTYIDEYDACILANAPPKPLKENYLIPIESKYYDFRLFCSVLDILKIKDFFLSSNPEVIIRFLKDPEYDYLIDMYKNVCEISMSSRDVLAFYRRLVDITNKFESKKKLNSILKYEDVTNLIQNIEETYEKQINNCSLNYIGGNMRKYTIIVTTPTEYEATANQFIRCGYKLYDDNINNLYFKQTKLNNGINISIVQTEMGALQVGGAFNTTHNIINTINPDAIIVCGICFGIKDKDNNRKMGDILVSTDIWDYETEKIFENSIDYRGKTIPVSNSLLQLFRRTSYNHQVPVHIGIMGAGDKNVNSRPFVEKLTNIQPHLIGGDMEGYAVVSVCQSQKKDCILVKSICDWGYDKDDEFQNIAANNSINFVIKALETIK